MIYGNIDNVARSLFEFDKIYTNYKEAMDNIENDGILLNRFILIDYTSNLDSNMTYEEQAKQKLLNQAIDNDIALKEEDKEKDSNYIYNTYFAHRADLKDYDGCICIKIWKSEEGYEYKPTINLKLGLLELQRQWTYNLAESSLDSYADYAKILSNFFNYNGMDITAIDAIWAKYFSYKDNLLTNDIDIIERIYKNTNSVISIDYSKLENTDTVLNRITIGNNNEGIVWYKEVDSLIGKYIYIFENGKSYLGTVKDVYGSFSETVTFTFTSNVVDFSNTERWTNTNIDGVLIIEPPETANNSENYVSVEDIKNLWYKGEIL